MTALGVYNERFKKVQSVIHNTKKVSQKGGQEMAGTIYQIIHVKVQKNNVCIYTSRMA